MLPRVVLYNAVSADGRIDWIAPDLGLFYGLAANWKEDATLAGSDTLLAAEGQESDEAVANEPPPPNPDDTRPLLVVVDSRGRVRNLRWLRTQPYWRDVVVLCSRTTPPDYLAYLEESRIDHLMVGDDRVDPRAALEELSVRYGVRTVRVDSGGTLNGVLLRAGLVDEFSLLIVPSLVGGTSPKSAFRAPDLTSPDGAIPLRLLQVETLADNHLWLRYEVVK